MNKKELAGLTLGVVVVVLAAMATPALASGTGTVTLTATLHGSFSDARVYIADYYTVENGQFVLGMPYTWVHFGSSSGTGSNAYWYTTDSSTSPGAIIASGTWHLNTYTNYGLTESSYTGQSQLYVYLTPSSTPTSRHVFPTSAKHSSVAYTTSSSLKLYINAIVDAHGGTQYSNAFYEPVGMSVEIPVDVDG